MAFSSEVMPVSNFTIPLATVLRSVMLGRAVASTAARITAIGGRIGLRSVAAALAPVPTAAFWVLSACDAIELRSTCDQ